MQGVLAGRNVLVTGAGRNVGRGIAREMARAGAAVLFTDVDEGRRAALERELGVHGPGARGFLSDVSRPADSDHLWRTLRAAGARPDVLVNNAGLLVGAEGVRAFRIEEWEATFRTNVMGPLHLTRLFVEERVAAGGGGSVVFVTSIHQWSVRRIPAYSASKAALGMIVRELALELAPHEIRVNAVAPGYVAEDARGSAVPHRWTPLRGASVSPADVGRATVFLASDQLSRSTTGALLAVDAGLSLVNHLVAEPRRGR